MIIYKKNCATVSNRVQAKENSLRLNTDRLYINISNPNLFYKTFTAGKFIKFISSLQIDPKNLVELQKINVSSFQSFAIRLGPHLSLIKVSLEGAIG